MNSTRQQILDLALRLTQESGFRGFSYRDLAEKIGVKTAAIHYHFPRKSDLGVALAQEYYQLDLDYLGKARNRAPKKRIDRLVQLFSETLDARLFCLFASAAADRGTVPPQMNEKASHFFDLAIDWIKTALDEAFSSLPAQQREIKHLELAREFMSLLYGAFLIAHNNGDSRFFEDAISSFRDSRLGL